MQMGKGWEVVLKMGKGLRMRLVWEMGLEMGKLVGGGFKDKNA